MEKCWKLFIICFLIISLFCSCGTVQADKPAVLNLVCQVDVSYDNQGIHLQRTYTTTDKMDAILFYLYSLHPTGSPDIDPEQIPAYTCQITVISSGGITHSYLQRGGQYLSVDRKPWRKIKPERSAHLFSLLARMSSDL